MDEFVTRAEHKEFAERIDKENDRQNKRLSELETAIKEITKITISIERLANSIENMQKELYSQGQRLKDIEDKPKNEWDKLKWVVIGAVVTGVVGFILGRFLV